MEGCSITNLDITTQGTRTLMSDVPVVARLGDCGGEVWKVPANNVFLDLHPGVARRKASEFKHAPYSPSGLTISMLGTPVRSYSNLFVLMHQTTTMFNEQLNIDPSSTTTTKSLFIL